MTRRVPGWRVPMGIMPVVLAASGLAGTLAALPSASVHASASVSGRPDAPALLALAAAGVPRLWHECAGPARRDRESLHSTARNRRHLARPSNGRAAASRTPLRRGESGGSNGLTSTKRTISRHSAQPPGHPGRPPGPAAAPVPAAGDAIGKLMETHGLVAGIPCGISHRPFGIDEIFPNVRWFLAGAWSSVQRAARCRARKSRSIVFVVSSMARS